MKKRLLIVDDHLAMRQGLAQLINLEADLEVCGQAATAAQALASARELQPDMLLADISLKDSDGLDLVKSLRAFLPKLPVLILSMHDESIYAERALRAGARGYLMKDATANEVISGVRALLRGEFCVSKSIQERFSERLTVDQPSSTVGGKELVDALSDRELQVLRLVGRGLGTRQIASDLHISVKTVESHRMHLKEKLKISTAPALVHFAVEWVHHTDRNKAFD